MSQAKALSAAGQLRGDLTAEDLAQKQAQWLVGRNPFSASLMYGEGYDWTPLYSVRSGPMVGALPVGIETKGIDDAPYWPTQICWTYKEVWTQPVGQWIWLMQDLAVPASVQGRADPANDQPVEFRAKGSGQIVTAIPNRMGSAFSLHLPEGQYEVRQGSAHTGLTVLPGRSYSIDLRPGHFLDFQVSFEDLGRGEMLVRVSAEGAGTHVFSIRSDNLILRDPGVLKMDLTSGKAQQAVWHAHVLAADTPWVALVIPDGALAERRELTGAEMQR